MKPKGSSILTGVSGEYFVAAELSRLGYIASITLRNTRGVDILVSDLDAQKLVGIQVKTTLGARRDWMMKKKAEDYFADNLFYVFVLLKQGLPEFYVVPSREVASHVRTRHAEWLVTPGKRGQVRNDSPLRKFSDHEAGYLNRWDLLGLS